MTSNQPQTNQLKKQKKNKLKGVANVEFNDQFLEEILDNFVILMVLAMQIVSTDKTVTNDTIEDLKDFNSQSLTTQAKKGEELISMMPAINKGFNLMEIDIVQLSTEDDALKK